MSRSLFLLAAAIGLGVAHSSPSAAGDPARGAEAFRACIACHTLVPGDHRSGPSLAGIVGREAATLPDFRRYSEALRRAGLVWDETTLDAWLADPEAMVPGNRMVFRGIADAEVRADLIAYLAAGEAVAGAPPAMRMAGEPADLRHDVDPNNRVSAIRHCGDTYTVEVETGEAHPFWEFNLRFKTDSSPRGPEPGQPVLIPAGMMGDRAFIVFADPAEISAAIERRC